MAMRRGSLTDSGMALELPGAPTKRSKYRQGWLQRNAKAPDIINTAALFRGQSDAETVSPQIIAAAAVCCILGVVFWAASAITYGLLADDSYYDKNVPKIILTPNSPQPTAAPTTADISDKARVFLADPFSHCTP